MQDEDHFQGPRPLIVILILLVSHIIDVHDEQAKSYIQVGRYEDDQSRYISLNDLFPDFLADAWLAQLPYDEDYRDKADGPVDKNRQPHTLKEYHDQHRVFV